MALPNEDFSRAVLPHLDAAYNLARWLTGSAATADDVVQDAALRALSAFAGFRGGDARAWFLRITRNVAYDSLAAAARRPTASIDTDAALQVADPAPDAEAHAAHRQGLSRLDAALAGLPRELRECLVLRELEELSYKEIARITGVPVGTVMSRLWRARQALIPARGKEDGP